MQKWKYSFTGQKSTDNGFPLATLILEEWDSTLTNDLSNERNRGIKLYDRKEVCFLG